MTPPETADLDQLGAVLDLVAHRLADLVDAVGDALLDRQLQHAGHERGEHRRVEVPARRRDRMAGGDHPRAVDPARVDGLAQRDVEQVAAGLDEQSEVAHGGEARRAACGGRCRPHAAPGSEDRPEPGTGRGSRRGPPIRRLTSMSIRPGSRIGVAEVDDLAVGAAPPMPTIRSPSIADDAGPDDLAGVDVEQTRCFEGQHRSDHRLLDAVRCRRRRCRARAAASTPRPGRTP